MSVHDSITRLVSLGLTRREKDPKSVALLNLKISRGVLTGRCLGRIKISSILAKFARGEHSMHLSFCEMVVRQMVSYFCLVRMKGKS